MRCSALRLLHVSLLLSCKVNDTLAPPTEQVVPRGLVLLHGHPLELFILGAGGGGRTEKDCG